MITKILETCNDIFIDVINKLKGSDRRIVLAKISKKYGYGGKTFVAKTFKIGKDTLKKGLYEYENNKIIEDQHNKKGRKKIVELLPNLKNDLIKIAGSQSQIDPKFQSERLYTRLTVSEFRKKLIEKQGYSDSELPTNQTLNTIINKLGYKLKKVKKSKPLKKIEETDLIFNNLNIVHETIAATDRVLRLSIDAKDRVKIGDFSRKGKSRTEKVALDHDFGKNYITPFGIMNFNDNEINVSLTESKITADYIVDRLEEYWEKNTYQDKIDVILINSDNGPENSSRRTQFIKRMIEFTAKINKKIILAYYPPYHSKYNPIERYWGRLESHWNGDLLDCKETILNFVKTATWYSNVPNVDIINKSYSTGIKVKDRIMKIYESALKRKKGIEKWFVILEANKCQKVLDVLLN